MVHVIMCVQVCTGVRLHVCVHFLIAFIIFSLEAGVSSFSEANSLRTILLITVYAMVNLFFWPL